jgi:hypothetical protein
MRSYLGALGIVAAITATIVGYVLWDEGRDSERRSAEAAAIGFVATPTRWYDAGDEEEVEGHTLTFSFVDGGNGIHAQTLEQVTWYDPRRTYKVCYDPQDADDHKLYPQEHVCGS